MALSRYANDYQILLAGGTAVLGGLAAYYYLTNSDSAPKATKIESIEIVKEKESGETAIYRHIKSKTKLCDSIFNGSVTNMKEFVTWCAKRYSKQPYIGSRVLNTDGTRGPFQFISYQETFERSENLARGLAAIGACGGDRIGFYSSNCMEWRIAEIACYLHNLVIVSLYDSLGPGAVKYIVSHSETNIVFCSASGLAKLIEAISSLQNNPIKHVVLLYNSNTSQNTFDEKLLQKVADMKIQTHKFNDLIELGKANANIELKSPAPTDMATIMYTSGTTGEPKGVMISHRNFVSVLAGFRVLESDDDYTHESTVEPDLDSGPKYLSYLPLAHIMERVTLHSVALFGGSIGFFSGDMQNLISDFTTLQPHYVAGAPRVYQKIAKSIKADIEKSGAIKQWLFHKAYEDKKQALKEGRTTPVWDKLIFNKIRDSVFGPNVGKISSGSAPLGESMYEFLRIVFSVNVTEGYGLTETTAGCCFQSTKCMTPGRVGLPVGSCEIKLVDVPELGYTSKDKPFPRGEICLRGPSVFMGYYKNPEKTKQVIDADGWFHTEDIGRLNEDNTFSIIDRKKNLFKLSFGEYVAPEYLEAVYGRSNYVAQCFVYGDSYESSLVGVIVPDPEVVKVWFAKNSELFPNQQFNLAELCKNPELKQAILEDLTRVGKEAKVLSYELLKDIHLEPEFWTLQNHILTPTFKLKRHECKNKYEKEIMTMYLKINGNWKEQ